MTREGVHYASCESAHRPARNPFSTRYTQPGAIPYIFPQGVSAADLVARLAALDWRASIVGSHGSGKSTLLAALAPCIVAAGRRPLSIVLHDCERSLTRHRHVLSAACAETLLIVDGYEQLSMWSRWRLHRLCRRRASGLLVTSHTPVGLPLLCTTQPDMRTAEAAIAALAAGEELVSRDDLAAAFTICGGNLREAFDRLYDLYELRRRVAVR